MDNQPVRIRAGWFLCLCINIHKRCFSERNTRLRRESRTSGQKGQGNSGIFFGKDLWGIGGIPAVFAKKQRDKAMRPRENTGAFPGTGGFFVILTCKPLSNPVRTGQSTENTKSQEKYAKRTLTNVRRRSIIRVLFLTNSEYYSFGGCIL